MLHRPHLVGVFGLVLLTAVVQLPVSAASAPTPDAPRVVAAQPPPLVVDHPPPALTSRDVARLIDVRTTADVVELRRELVSAVWPGTSSLDYQRLPESVTRGIGDEDYVRPTAAQRIDELRIEMAYGVFSVAHHLIARRSQPAPCLVIYHHGHDEPFTAGLETITHFLEIGCDVLALSMPLTGRNSQPVIDVEGIGPLALSTHNALELLESADFSPLSYFVEPTLAALNHALSRSDYARIGMIGISGGGWTTTIYAALDPRVQGSYPVAGSLPLFLRTMPPHDSWGDYEQVHPTLRRIGYLDLYLMGAVGTGREQVQVLHPEDPCCFSGTRSDSYASLVTGRARRSEAGSFRVHLDRTHARHAISDSVLDLVATSFQRLPAAPEPAAAATAAVHRGPSSAPYVRIEAKRPIQPARLAELMTIRLPRDVDRTRRLLRSHVWPMNGTDHLTHLRPTVLRRSPNDLTYGGMRGLVGVDELRFTMRHGVTSVAHVLHPTRPARCAMIFHSDYGEDFTRVLALFEQLLASGCIVAGMDLPLSGPRNSQPVADIEGVGRVSLVTPDYLSLLETPEFSTLSYFADPVVGLVDWLEELLPRPGSGKQQRIGMTGYRDGGWATVLAAAVDPRIQASYPIQPGQPLFLRTLPPVSGFGRYPQRHPAFRQVRYLDLYALGASGQGRRQLHLVPARPGTGLAHQRAGAYGQAVGLRVDRLGQGAFAVATSRADPSTDITQRLIDRLAVDFLSDVAPDCDVMQRLLRGVSVSSLRGDCRRVLLRGW
jgi:cephalosporin-C deacetylase-like acetyl esterase